ncbi:MAG TPA: hypothetical protein VGQ57_15345, partial [Polyangiaceae bacterium]|nr:hypothetical protein [Polyangiaceae bacterium]
SVELALEALDPVDPSEQVLTSELIVEREPETEPSPPTTPVEWRRLVPPPLPALDVTRSKR